MCQDYIISNNDSIIKNTYKIIIWSCNHLHKHYRVMQEHRSKHIDIRYHYIRECVEDKKVILHYVPTTEQIADIMTKCLSYDKFKKFRNQLGITIS